MRQLYHDRRGATAIEYAMLLALVALALAFLLPDVMHSVQSTMITAREGMSGKVCVGDPTARGTQCH